MSKQSNLEMSAKISLLLFYPTAKGLSASGTASQTASHTCMVVVRKTSAKFIKRCANEGRSRCWGLGRGGIRVAAGGREAVWKDWDGMGWNYSLENSSYEYHNFQCAIHSFIFIVFFFPKNDSADRKAGYIYLGLIKHLCDKHHYYLLIANEEMNIYFVECLMQCTLYLMCISYVIIPTAPKTKKLRLWKTK